MFFSNVVDFSFEMRYTVGKMIMGEFGGKIPFFSESEAMVCIHLWQRWSPAA